MLALLKRDSSEWEWTYFKRMLHRMGRRPQMPGLDLRDLTNPKKIAVKKYFLKIKFTVDKLNQAVRTPNEVLRIFAVV